MDELITDRHTPAGTPLEIIERILSSRIPGAAAADLEVMITENGPAGMHNSWSSTPRGLAGLIHVGLFGSDTAAATSALALAEDAKRRRDLAGEICALMDGQSQLQAAPWYPSQPGDLVHIAFAAFGPFPAYGETYVIEAADPEPFLNLRLLHHTPDLPEEIEALAGAYAVDQDPDPDPLMEAWFEAGPSRITVVRDGAVIPNTAAAQ